MGHTLLSDLLETSARSENGITYVIGETKEKFLPYNELQNKALTLLGYFQGKGISPGQEMLILINNNERFVDVFWACILGGIIPVPLSTGISDSHSEKIVGVYRKLKNPRIYTSSDELSRLEAYINKHGYGATIEDMRKRSVVVEEITEAHGKGVPYESDPQELALIQFSSGSTGEPKGVMLSHENLLSNIQAITHGSNFTSKDRTFGWMPLTHDLGLVGFHLVPMASGAKQMLMSTELFVRRPMLWMQKSSEHQITITCSPNFGYKHFLKYFNPEAVANLDLSRIRLVLNGAEPISAALCREFMNRLDDYGLNMNAMFPVYGLAEASLAVSFPNPGAPLETILIQRKTIGIGETVQLSDDEKSLELVKLGRPVEFCSLAVTDLQGNDLPELTVGKLKISGKNVSKGYYEDQKTTDALIHNGWLDTGDLGFVHEDSLVLTGRSKDVIFLNGQNLYPHDLEHILDQTDELEIGKTAVTGVIDAHKMLEEPAVFVLYRGSLEEFVPLTQIIKGHLSAYIGLEVEKVLPVQSIPKTTSGKIQRFLLAERYHSGEFNDIENELKSLQSASKEESDRAASEIEVTLLDICKEFLSVDIKIEDNLFELGTSSLVLTQIHDRIDVLWPNRLELTDYFDYPTISELARYLKQEADQSV
jgi:acyl-CoA synthetase (AMP-forming)/AMP-acid ligase II